MRLMGKSACLWHAYDALKEQGKGSVNAGQLKVLTHNLATCVGMSDADCQALLIAIGPSTDLTEYLTFLSDALFARLPSAAQQQSLQNNSKTQVHSLEDTLEKIDEVCWMICSKGYTGSDGDDGRTVKKNEMYKLWRIFNALAEPADTPSRGDTSDYENEAALPVAMHREEVDVVLQRLCAILKIPFVAGPTVECSHDLIDFMKVVDVIKTRCLKDRDVHVTSAAIGELYDEIVANVLKKGYLVKLRGGLGVPGLSDQLWYVLTPTLLCYYTRRDEEEKRGEIAVSKSWKVENLSDRSGLAIAGIGIRTRSNCFAVHFADGGRMVELSAPDVQTKSEWLQALQQAIDWAGPSSSAQGAALSLRRAARAEQRDRLRAEEARQAADSEKIAATLRQLEAERKAREEAELRCHEEAKQRELEQQRIRELEELQRQLQILLDEERRMKRDEEIVRNLQAKVLQEEFEKREELEAIKSELERLLVEEQSKSGELEERRGRQEALYREEMARLEALEAERRQRNEEYQMALDKLRDAEQAKGRLRVELDRRESELRLKRGIAFRCHRAESADEGSPLSPSTPGEITSHRGRGAFVLADFEGRRPAAAAPDSDTLSPPTVACTPIAEEGDTTSSSTPLSSSETSFNGQSSPTPPVCSPAAATDQLHPLDQQPVVPRRSKTSKKQQNEAVSDGDSIDNDKRPLALMIDGH